MTFGAAIVRNATNGSDKNFATFARLSTLGPPPVPPLHPTMSPIGKDGGYRKERVAYLRNMMIGVKYYGYHLQRK